ncbi:hypothetical protein [Streptomyces sp. NPDC055013]
MSTSMWRHGVGKTFMAAVAVAVVGGVLPSSVSAHAVAAGGAATSPAAQASDAIPAQAEAASTLAAQTGEPVEVLFERTEYSEVFAQPDGSFKLTQSTAPQRVRTSDRSWKPVDVTLAKRADGRIAPKATSTRRKAQRCSPFSGAATAAWTSSTTLTSRSCSCSPSTM